MVNVNRRPPSVFLPLLFTHLLLYQLLISYNLAAPELDQTELTPLAIAGERLTMLASLSIRLMESDGE